MDFNDTGYLIVFIMKKIYARINVRKSKDNKLRLVNQEDLFTIENGLKMFFELNQNCGQEDYQELILSWKNEDKMESLPITPIENNRKNLMDEKKKLAKSLDKFSDDPNGLKISKIDKPQNQRVPESPV